MKYTAFPYWVHLFPHNEYRNTSCVFIPLASLQEIFILSDGHIVSFISIFQVTLLQPESLPKKLRVIIKNVFILCLDFSKYLYTDLDIITLNSCCLILIKFYVTDKNHLWTYRERDCDSGEF